MSLPNSSQDLASVELLVAIAGSGCRRRVNPIRARRHFSHSELGSHGQQSLSLLGKVRCGCIGFGHRR